MAKSVSIDQVIKNLKVAQGEVFNVVDAVLRDITFDVKGDIESGWPVDTGRSIAGFETKRTSEAQDVVKWSVVNDVEYVPSVWDDPAHGGPPGLVYRLIADAYDKDAAARISERILKLLV
jgi:hypothetical protein